MKWYIIVGIIVVIILIVILGVFIYKWIKGYRFKKNSNKNINSYDRITGGDGLNISIQLNENINRINKLIKNKTLFIIDKNDKDRICYELFTGIIEYIKEKVTESMISGKPKLKKCYEYLEGIATNEIFNKTDIYFCGMSSARFKKIYDLIDNY